MRWPEALRSPGRVIALTVLVGTLVRLPQLGHPLLDLHSFRQTQTAYVALRFAQNGIDLGSTPLPLFGEGSQVPFELPLWQAVAALLIRTGLDPDLACRILGLVTFQATAVLMGLLVARWHGSRPLVLAAVGFQVVPFSLLWGASALIDFGAAALSLGLVLAVDSWLTRGGWPALVGAVVTSILAFLVKPTTAAVWLPLLAAVCLAHWRTRRTRAESGTLPRLAAAALVVAAGGIAALLWTRYADGVKRANPLTARLTSDQLTWWNYGTIHQRLDPRTWVEIGGIWGFTIVGIGCVGLILGILAALRDRGRARSLTIGWIAVAFVGPLTFTNLYYQHSYYSIAVFPALMAVTASGIAWLADQTPPPWLTARAPLRLALVCVLGMPITALGRDYLSRFAAPPAEPTFAAAIDAVAGPTDRVVLGGCDWNPQWLYYARREGLMLLDYRDAAVWSREDIDRYAAIVTCGSAQPATFLPAGAVADRQQEITYDEDDLVVWRIVRR